MKKNITELFQQLDGLTAVKLLRHVGPMLFKDPEIRGLSEGFAPTVGWLADLANLPPPRKRELIRGKRSIWLARTLLAMLASEPRFASILARALQSLPTDELVAEASIPRGLVTESVRLLASAREMQKIGVELCMSCPDEPWPGTSEPDPLLDLAKAALAPEAATAPEDARSRLTAKIAEAAKATEAAPQPSTRLGVKRSVSKKEKPTRRAWPH